jgi:hypothetical protein
MGIRVEWDDTEQTIIRWGFEPDWDWNDFNEAFKCSLEMGRKVGYRVDVIPNATRARQLPLGALGQFKRISENVSDNTRLIVITGANSITNAIINTFSKVYKIDSWITVTSLEQARAVIAQDRAKEQKDRT